MWWRFHHARCNRGRPRRWVLRTEDAAPRGEARCEARPPGALRRQGRGLRDDQGHRRVVPRRRRLLLPRQRHQVHLACGEEGRRVRTRRPQEGALVPRLDDRVARVEGELTWRARSSTTHTPKTISTASVR